MGTRCPEAGDAAEGRSGKATLGGEVVCAETQVERDGRHSTCRGPESRGAAEGQAAAAGRPGARDQWGRRTQQGGAGEPAGPGGTEHLLRWRLNILNVY